MKKVTIFSLIVCLLMSSQVQADDLDITEFGKLFISNFSPNTYESGNQNWDICTGDNGLLYVANGAFLLEGGSNTWHTYAPGKNIIVRSVHKCRDGGILVGANEEIGIFRRRGLPGETEYTSIMDKLDSAYHSFGSIWQILEKDSVYYFRAGKGVFTFSNDSILPVVFGIIVDYMQFHNEKLLVQESNVGLGVINNGVFVLLPFGEFFSDKKIVSITSLNKEEFLIFTDNHGVFIADDTGIRKYDRFCIPEIIESQIKVVRALEGKYMAIGTVRNGLYILNNEGTIIQHLNKNNGLQNNTIINMFVDGRNNLWLALDYGISYVFLNSCLSVLNSDMDLGTGYVSKLFKGKLYLGTNQGLYYTNWDHFSQPGFEVSKVVAVKNSAGQVWDLEIIGDQLYCSHHKGLFKIQDNEAVLVSPLEGSWSIHELNSMPGYFIQSTYRGYFLYKLDESGELALIKELKDIQLIREFSQDELGYIWNVIDQNVIWCYKLDPSTLNITDIQTFGFEYHSFKEVRIVGDAFHVIFNTEQGFYTFNRSTGKFESLDFYNELFPETYHMLEFFEDKYERIWFVSEENIGYLSTKYGKLDKVISPFNLISDSYTYYFGKINVIDENNILFGADQGFYHIGANCARVSAKDHITHIIDLRTTHTPVKYSTIRSKDPHPVYAHKRNRFEFVFNSNMMETQERIQYSCFLDGYDETWSEWSYRESKEYTNLPGGTYTFLVKAKDESGSEGTIASFLYRVRPPVYLSIYAYLTYAIISVLLILWAFRLRDKKIETEKLKIERKKQQEVEERKKKYDEEQMKSTQQITKLVNEGLHQDLKHKSKELSNSMINILHKNEILLNIKQEMQELYLEKNLHKRDFKIKNLMYVIDREISTKKDLEVFDSNFNAVHEEFLKNLKKQYPNLTQHDHRLCTFIKMNKSSKEIATFLNLSIRGVETGRYRLRKKLGLDADANLYDIISAI